MKLIEKTTAEPTFHAHDLLLRLLPTQTEPESALEQERVSTQGRQNGLIEALETGEIVAGFETYKACLVAGVTPEVRTIAQPDDLPAYIVQRNVPRHLSQVDRACIAVLYSETAKMVSREGMREGGRLKGRCKDDRASEKGTRWFEVAARIVGGVKPSAVKTLASIFQNAPEIFALVRDRQLGSLTDARDLMKRLTNSKDRKEAMKRYKSAPKKHGVPPKMRDIATQIVREKRTDLLDGANKGNRYLVLEGDMIEQASQVADESIDLMYADIPYGQVLIATAVGSIAAKKLREGCVLALLNGQEQSLQVLNAVTESGLTLIAVGALHCPGSTLGVKSRIAVADANPVYFFAKGKYPYHPVRKTMFVSDPKGPDHQALHPWQKDVGSTKQILQAIAPADNGTLRVLDPCAGAGTSGHAALELGWEVVLIEKEPKFAAVIRSRMEGLDREIGAQEVTRLLEEHRATGEPSLMRGPFDELTGA